MRDQTSADIKRRMPTERVEIVGYACWVIGRVCLLLITLPYFDFQLRVYLSASGLAIFGIGTGFIGLGVARKSDKRMAAMASLEFYEKIAVIENYINYIRSGPNVVSEAIYNDIKAAKQLKRYVKPEVEEELNRKIQELIDIALQGSPYGNLVSRLQDVQKEDC